MDYLPKTVDSQFMIRILRNEATAEEKDFFEQWLQESDEHKEVYANTAWMWDRMAEAKTPPEPDPELLWSQIAQRIHVEDPLPISSTHGLVESRSRSAFPKRLAELWDVLTDDFIPRFTSYALPAVTIVFVAIGIYTLYKSASAIRVGNTDVVTTPVVQMREVVTRRGQRATVPLADGTVVYLNADSKLRFPETFTPSSRELELTGEAYFAVTHDPQRPFRVTTGDAITEVKGTEFNVRYRKSKLNVVVSKGAVRLYNRTRDKGVDLRKGELASYSQVIGFTQPRKVDVRQYVAWRENKLSFVKTPLRDVMSEIEMFYNVRVVFKTMPFRHNTLTGYFALDSLDEVLSNIAVAMDVRIKRDGQTIVVY